MQATMSHDVRGRRGQEPLPGATVERSPDSFRRTDHGTRSESSRRPTNSHTGGDTGAGKLPLREKHPDTTGAFAAPKGASPEQRLSYLEAVVHNLITDKGCEETTPTIPRRPVDSHTGGDTGVGQLPLR